ncbi:MAG TPA: hypothetical protein VGY48_32430 [Vicinamibacterales bacterium]|nr:hypothetical protein [Vicinamibacterales bacterium]
MMRRLPGASMYRSEHDPSESAAERKPLPSFNVLSVEMLSATSS